MSLPNAEINLQHIRPTPAIVINLGKFASQVSQSIQQIYLRSHGKRAAVTAFKDIELNADFIPMIISRSSVDQSNEETNEIVGENANTLEIRKAAFQSIVQHADAIKADIERDLHTLRTHERLIAAGWEQIYDVPVNLFMLADITDPITAGMVFPMMAILHQIIMENRLCFGNLLLSFGIFPERNEERNLDLEIQIYTFLQELDGLLEHRSESWGLLKQKLDFEDIDPWLPAIYLFGHHKDGSYVVKDRHELQTILGNALLILLQGDIARQLTQYHDDHAIYETRSFYNSIGASALIYDPESLQAYCAKKLSVEFMQNYILAGTVDAQLVISETKSFQNRFGNLKEWIGRLVATLPDEISQVMVHSETLEITTILKKFSLQMLDFENLRQTPWVLQFELVWEDFRTDIHGHLLKCIENSSQKWSISAENIIRDTIQTLPLKPTFYPGGVVSALKTLDLIARGFDAEQNFVSNMLANLPAKEALIDEQITSLYAQMQDIIMAAPVLPKLFQILPAFLRQWIVPFYFTLRYGREILQLQNLKTDAQQLLWLRIGLKAQFTALEHISAAIPRWKELIIQGQEDYRRLDDKFHQVCGQLLDIQESFPLGLRKNAWHDLFRAPVMEPSFAEWSYQNWQPDLKKWVVEFLGDKSICKNWAKISSASLYDWLVSHGRFAYIDVWQLSIKDVYNQWEALSLLKESQTVLHPLSLKSKRQATFPLLRPDFDAIGGNRISHTSAHILMGYPEWEIIFLPHANEKLMKWEKVHTQDPFTLIYAQMRHTAPLKAFVDLIQVGKQQFSAMPPEVQANYRILTAKEFPGITTTEVTRDLDDSDTIQKIFRWSFQPKGGRHEIDQSIDLKINHKRYEYYKNQPRFNGQWNLYAEVEMPEVRQLAFEFQRLHADQDWSTFNQVYNVLKFVQCCIPYSRDIETTEYSDWPRYPIETLIEQTGDCEDVAVLCAAIIVRLGYPAVLLNYPGHVAFGVAGADHLKGDYIVEPTTGKKFYYGEATANGWHLGQIPPKYRDMAPEAILPVNILIEEN